MTEAFYNRIIKEASQGLIKTYEGSVLIKYNTLIPEKNISYGDINDEDVPILCIEDFNKFNDVLENYLKESIEFYKNFHYDLDVVMSTMFDDATYEDFNFPIQYLNRRISFMKDDRLNEFLEEKCVGYIPSLKGNLYIKMNKDSVWFETPYNMQFCIRNEDEEFYFPTINFGLDGNRAYIYTIQNRMKYNDRTKLHKDIKRKLYKIGQGFDEKDFIDENDSIKDITPSFVVCANMMLPIFKKIGIDEIVLPSFRPIRFFNKLTTSLKYKDNDKIPEDKKITVEKVYEIQKNLTEKFINTFIRLNYHYDGMDITFYPFDIDSSMYIKLSDTLKSNNDLLNETYDIIESSKGVKL